MVAMGPAFTPRLAPYLVVKDARGLIRFIEGAIGGKLTFEVTDAGGRLVHSEMRIADGLVMIGELPVAGVPFPTMLHLYVEDADAAHRRALAAGAMNVRTPVPSDGNLHRGGVKDSWGNEWWFSSPTSPLPL